MRSVQPPHVRFIDGTTKSTNTSMTTECRSLEPVAIGAAPPPLQRCWASSALWASSFSLSNRGASAMRAVLRPDTHRTHLVVELVVYTPTDSATANSAIAPITFNHSLTTSYLSLRIGRLGSPRRNGDHPWVMA